MTDLSKLESIRFGDAAFYHAPQLYLGNLMNLRSVSFGDRAFFEVVTMHFISRDRGEMACRFAQAGDGQFPAE